MTASLPSRGRVSVHRFWRFALALFVPTLAGCQAPLTEVECGQLLDRYADKLIDATRPSVTPGERARLVSETREAASRDPQFVVCPLRVSRAEFDCAMAAPSVDAMERCLL